MTGRSSELGAANRHRDDEQAQADDQPQRGETMVLDCPDDRTVTDPTGDAPPCPTMLLDDDLLSADTGKEPPTAQSENRLQQQEQKSVHPLDSLKKAIAAAQSGNKILARLHLEGAVASNPDNPAGWLWLAWVADSPAAAISALEQSRLNSPNPTLLEHGLAWARGMQEFQLELSGLENHTGDRESQEPTAECAQSDPRPKDAHPGPVTQRLETGPTSTSVLPTNGTLPVAECGMIAPGTTQAEAAAGQTFPLDQETTPAQPLFGPPIENEPGTASTRRNEGPRQDAIATPSPQKATESSVNDVGRTIAFGGGELAAFVSQMDLLADSSGPGADNSPTSSAPPSVVDLSSDQPDDRVAAEPSADEPSADEPSADDQIAVEDVSPGSMDLTPPCEQPTILAIDDSPTVRSLVSITLQKCGYQVVTATDGVDALNRIKTCKPALILLDVNMPRLNGYQLCKLLKKHKEMRQIPVIMLSGKDGVFDKFRGNMCGCDDYITKPFESADLVKKISAFLTGVVTQA